MQRVASSGSLTGPSFPMKTESYELKDIIGYGASAVVWRAICLTNKIQVAIKIIDLEACTISIDQVRREVLSLQFCNHPNVVKYHCSFIVGHTLWLVMQYVSGGSCQDIMRYKFKTGFDRDAISSILFQVLNALSYLHQNHFLHRDIRSGNILLDSDGTALLTDFGLSTIFTGTNPAEFTPIEGTLNWLPPEILRGMPPTNKGDIWSLGITALELARGQPPYSNIPSAKVVMLILDNPPPTFDLPTDKEQFSRSLKDMVDNCLRKDASQRLTADACLKHRFFKKHLGRKEHIVSSIISKIPPLPQRAVELDIPRKAMAHQIYYGKSTPQAVKDPSTQMTIQKYYANGMMSDSFGEQTLGKIDDDLWDFGTSSSSGGASSSGGGGRDRDGKSQKPYVYIRS